LNLRDKHLFYFDGELTELVTLNDEESRHCALSLRLKIGDHILLTNGRGRIALGSCVSLSPKASKINILQVDEVLKPKAMRRLCVAPPKTGERLDWMIEKAIEIGVDEFIFLETQNSERSKLNPERLHKIAVSTIKQSKQAYLPEFLGIIKWKDFLSSNLKGDKFIAHVSDSSLVPLLTKSISNQYAGVNILIGPEGDFTNEEVSAAIAAGFKEVSLGPNVLRTETAAVHY